MLKKKYRLTEALVALWIAAVAAGAYMIGSLPLPIKIAVPIISTVVALAYYIISSYGVGKRIVGVPLDWQALADNETFTVLSAISISHPTRFRELIILERKDERRLVEIPAGLYNWVAGDILATNKEGIIERYPRS